MTFSLTPHQTALSHGVKGGLCVFCCVRAQQHPWPLARIEGMELRVEVPLSVNACGPCGLLASREAAK